MASERNLQHDPERPYSLIIPYGLEYQKAKEMFNTGARGYGSTYYGSGGYSRRATEDDACDCCTKLICLDCICEMCGGDLIRCI